MARWIFTYILAMRHTGLILLDSELLGETAVVSFQRLVEAERSLKKLFLCLNYYHGVHSRP